MLNLLIYLEKFIKSEIDNIMCGSRKFARGGQTQQRFIVCLFDEGSEKERISGPPLACWRANVDPKLKPAW